MAIPNRNDQHVRSGDWKQERDEGWLFQSRGVSTGNAGAGAGPLLARKALLRNVSSVRQIWGRGVGVERDMETARVWAGELEKGNPKFMP